MGNLMEVMRNAVTRQMAKDKAADAPASSPGQVIRGKAKAASLDDVVAAFTKDNGKAPTPDELASIEETFEMEKAYRGK